ncbi:MAG: hypothetical protein AAFY46_01820, partial [Planctomycetota bacterium]
DAVASEPVAPAAEPAPAPEAPPAPAGAPKPKLRVANWWTGRYDTEGVPEPAVQAVSHARRATPRPQPREAVRRPAREQLKNARARAAERRKRAVTRVADRRRNLRTQREKAAGLNPGAAIAIGVVVGLVSIPVSVLLFGNAGGSSVAIAESFEGQASASAHAVADARASSPPTPAPPRAIPAAAPVVAGQAGSILLVSTFNQPVDAKIEGLIDATVGQLTAKGFDVFDAAADGDPSNVALIADVRATRFIGSSKGKDAARQMRSWFDNGDFDYDAMVIVEPDPDSVATGTPTARALIVDEDSAAYENHLSPRRVAQTLAEVIDD